MLQQPCYVQRADLGDGRLPYERSRAAEVDRRPKAYRLAPAGN